MAGKRVIPITWATVDTGAKEVAKKMSAERHFTRNTNRGGQKRTAVHFRASATNFFELFWGRFSAKTRKARGAVECACAKCCARNRWKIGIRSTGVNNFRSSNWANTGQSNWIERQKIVTFDQCLRGGKGEKGGAKKEASHARRGQNGFSDALANFRGSVFVQTKK